MLVALFAIGFSVAALAKLDSGGGNATGNAGGEGYGGANGGDSGHGHYTNNANGRF